MKLENYRKYQEYQRLIAEYDWAVEGMSAPKGNSVSRTVAVEIRTNLVNLASKVEL